MSSLSDFDYLSQVKNPSEFVPPEGGLIVYRTFTPDGGCQTPNRPMLKAVNPDTREVLFFRPLCKTRSCSYCRQILAKRWVIRAVEGAKVLSSVGVLDFLTVTSHEKLDPSGSLAVLPKAWKNLHRRVERASGDQPAYYAVPEQHKNGRWHMHAIINVHLSRKWWKDNARSCGLGYQSDVQEVHSLGGVSFYVTKYLTKTLQNSNLPKGAKVVRTSHNWPPLPELPMPPGWTFRQLGKRELNLETDRYLNLGYSVVLADADGAWDWLENWSPAGR